MMFRKIVASLVFLGFANALSAQQRPQYTQYIFNNFLLNPALSGIENYVDVKAGYRNQWTGISNAPVTIFATANFSLGNNYLWKNALSLAEDDRDPMSRNYMQNYTASPPHHGIGVTFVSDKTGPISRVDANVTYAYHLKMGERLNLSTGIALGVSRINLNLSDLNFEYPDPAINKTIVSQFKPDVSVGVWLYGASFFAGASIQQVLPQSLSFTNEKTNPEGKERSHYFITTGYRFFVAEDISAIPSVMVKYVPNTPTSIDVNAKFAFKERFWVGGSYRKSDSFSAMAGVNVNRLVNITYSYDFTTSGLNKVSNGSHEIVLGLQLNNIYEVASRIPIW